MIKHTFLA